MSTISRRSLLGFAGATAVALGTGGLTACGTGAGRVGNEGKQAAPFPKYAPVSLVKPDLPGTEAGIQDAFLSYPKQPAQTVSDTPGDGSVVTAVVITYGSAPTPAERNKLWAAINKALGVDLRLTIVNAADLNAKYATMIAGGDLPDIIATIDVTMPNALAFTQAKCADLTDYISGDAITDYPNLANLPAFAWESVGRIGGRLYGIPVPRARIGGANFGNAEALAKAGITGARVSTDQFSSGVAQLAGGKHYPLGGNSFGGYYHLWADGIASSWSLVDGAITTNYDDPRYTATLNRLRDWNSKGYYYPDILATQITQAQTLFMNGTTYSITNGIGSYPALISGVGKAFTVDIVRPYGAKPAVGLGNGIFSNSGRGGFTALKQASPERIKLLLRLLNFLAAPFGSAEYELINYGVEGVHFTRSTEGDPMPTELATNGGENTTNLPLRYIAAGPYVLYLSGAPEATRRNHAAQTEIVPLGVADPTVGLVSETQAAKGPKLSQLINDAVNEIIGGKRPVSDWTSVVEQWKQQGGSAVTSEYSKQYTAR